MLLGMISVMKNSRDYILFFYAFISYWVHTFFFLFDSAAIASASSVEGPEVHTKFDEREKECDMEG